MSPTGFVVRIRNTSLAIVDRSPTARRLMARSIRRLLERRGPLNVIADEAVEGAAEREAKRTAEMLMWSGAVAGTVGFPMWFPAAHHIHNPEGRRLSAAALERFLADHPDTTSHIWRQYFALAEPEALDEVQQFVQRDLRDRLTKAPVDHGTERVSLSSARQLEILERSTRALEAVGIRPFLVSGTLLGCVRDGQLMEHDYDIDLGVLPGDGDGDADAEAIAGALAAAGFDVTAQELKVVARDESGFSVDVFLHYERDDLIWHGTEIHEWWNTPFELVHDELNGVDVWVPDDAERYLDENYGEWQQPVAFYNFSFDTPNRCYRQTPQALLYLHKRLTNAIVIGDRWTVESAARELRDGFGVDVTDTLAPSPLIDPTPETS